MATERRSADDMRMEEGTDRTCPECQQGDLISISMNVGETGLSFTTCHLCEAKWWYRDGESVPLRSVIGGVISRQS
jgi:formate dehydrogenase maturation protein FdhE